MAHDVFISYSSKDKTIADAVCAKLEEHKIRAWIAPRDVPPGSNFAESIIRAINNCKVFVLIWSANSNTSNHILNEINQAFDQGITIIPFRIQDIQPTDEMRYYFGRTHWLDAITPPLEKHIAVLRDTILINLGRELEPSAPPPGLEESPKETVKPADEPRPVMEPVIEKAEEAEPLVASLRPQKSPEIEEEIHRPAALPAKFTKYIPFAVGGLVVLTLVVLAFSGVFKGSPSEEMAQASPSTTSAVTATRTLSPTAIFTAIPTPIPAWMEEASAVAEPILTAIGKFQPDFEDDFSQVDPNWFSGPDDPGQCPNASDTQLSIADGSMKYSIINCQVGNLHFPDMQYANYVLQLDVNFQGVPLGLEFRNWGQSSLGEDVQLDYHIHHDASWGFSVWENGNFVEGINGNYGLDFSKPITITIINKSPTFIIYVKSDLLTFYNTQEEYDGFGLDFTVNSWGVTPTETLTLELDNFKIWDLDRIDEVNAMAESVLSVINKVPPDFADDFSQVDPNWFSPPGGVPPECINPGDAVMSISDGAMKYSITNCQVGNLQYADMVYANYVLQLDVNFQGAPLGLEFRNYGQSVMLDYYLQGLDGNWGFQVVEDEDFIEQINGHTSLDFSKPITIMIINKSPIFVVYVDSSLLTLYNWQEAFAGPFLLDFTVNSWDVTPTETLTLELDNVKIWDLDKIEDDIAVSESILVAVQDLPPHFADDFSQVDPNWFSGPDNPGQCPNASDVVMSITDGSMKYSITNCPVGHLQYADMAYANYVLQLDINYLQDPLDFNFRNWSQSPLDGNLLLDYYLRSPDGQWAFGAWEDGDFVEGIDGHTGLDSSKPVTITIIYNSPVFTVYLDSSLLTLYTTQEVYEGPFTLDFTISGGGVTPTETLTLEVDNLKIWDLEGIEY